MRRQVRNLVVGAALLTLAGCPAWPVPGQNPDNTGHNAAEDTITAANVSQLEEKWTWVEDAFGPAPASAPVASTGGIHVTVGCSVVTLDPATGTQNWATPLVDDEFNCEAPMGGTMSDPYTFAAADGGTSVVASFEWIVPTSGTARNWYYSTRTIDAATGAVEGPGNVSLTRALRGTEILGSSYSEVAFLPEVFLQIRNLGGGSGRSFRVSTYSGVGPSPAFATTGTGDFVFQSGTGAMTTSPGPPTHGYGIRAFSKATASPGCVVQTIHPSYPTVDLECPVWVNPLDGTLASSAVLDNAAGTLFVATAGGNLYALDQATGATLWSASGAGARPALADGLLWMSTNDGRILTFDAAGCGAATCSPVGEFDTGTGADLSNPVVAGGVVYATGGGSVFAFDKAGCPTVCAPLWSTATGGTYLSSPVVNQGQVYVSTGSSLIAYGLP